MLGWLLMKFRIIQRRRAKQLISNETSRHETQHDVIANNRHIYSRFLSPQIPSLFISFLSFDSDILSLYRASQQTGSLLVEKHLKKTKEGRLLVTLELFPKRKLTS